jgi:sugar/nucleoside kinase (ribokinase family)
MLKQRVPVLAVKLGAEGAMACGPSGFVRSAAPAVEAIDPVGAGDSFDAGFIHAYVRGADLGDCLAQGNAAGALSTTRPGGTEAFRDRAYFAQFFSQQGARANRHD